MRKRVKERRRQPWRAWLSACALGLCVGSGAGMVAGCDTSHVDSVNQMSEGLAAYKSGDGSRAKDLLRKAITTDPTNHRAHYQLGVMYLKSDDFEDAAEKFEDALKLRDDYSEYSYNLGDAHYRYARELLTGKDKRTGEALSLFKKAKEAYAKAVDVDKYYGQAWLMLGRTHEELGEVEEAIGAYELAIKSDPMDPLGYLELGQLYSYYAFEDEAAKVLVQGVRNLPDNALLHTELGNVYLDRGSAAEAKDAFDTARKINETKGGERKDVLPALFGLGIAHAEMGNTEDAKKWLRSFVENAGSDKGMVAQVAAARGKISEIERDERKKEKK